MALGRRQRERQEAFWIATQDLPGASGHPFYEKLNRLLDEAEFDEFVESLCVPYYAAGTSRPGILPGVYFRASSAEFVGEFGFGWSFKCVV